MEIAEQRYLGLYQFIDLTKDFFFSYTYDLTRTLQHNMVRTHPVAKSKMNSTYKSMYAWNENLTRDMQPAFGGMPTRIWALVLVHGAFVHRKFSLFGRITNLILIARRSRHFAGTRYLKRGVNDSGQVANDVEIEQIIHDEGMIRGIYSSHVQVRGSIPIYWTQETSVTLPKPPIVLNKVDPSYLATRIHFHDLLQRYSAPILILDLTKQVERKEQERILSCEYRQSIECINQTIPRDECVAMQHKKPDSALCDSCHRQSEVLFEPKSSTSLGRLLKRKLEVRYCALDFSQVSKQEQLNVLRALDMIAEWSLQETSFFCTRPIHFSKGVTGLGCCDVHGTQIYCPGSHLEQNGILRTNCIDCLDRTNVAQFTIGAYALSQALAATGETF